MGGSTNKPPSKTLGPGPYAPHDDPCDIDVEIDLVGVDPGVLAGIKKGDALTVSLKTAGSIKSVICVTGSGKIAGSLAAFRGLAQLIKCLEKGEAYQAVVQTVSKTSCHVLVSRL